MTFRENMCLYLYKKCQVLLLSDIFCYEFFLLLSGMQYSEVHLIPISKDSFQTQLRNSLWFGSSVAVELWHLYKQHLDGGKNTFSSLIEKQIRKNPNNLNASCISRSTMQNIKHKHFKNLWKMKQERCVWSRTNHFLKYPQEDLLKKIMPITSINWGIKILKKLSDHPNTQVLVC